MSITQLNRTSKGETYISYGFDQQDYIQELKDTRPKKFLFHREYIISVYTNNVCRFKFRQFTLTGQVVKEYNNLAQATINLMNIPVEVIHFIEQNVSNIRISIQAGYRYHPQGYDSVNDALPLIFSGDIETTYSYSDDVDVITTINLRSNSYKVSTSYTNKSINANTDVKDIFLDIAKSLGLSLNYQVNTARINGKQKTIEGSTFEVINNLCRQYHLLFYIDSITLNVFDEYGELTNKFFNEFSLTSTFGAGAKKIYRSGKNISSGLNGEDGFNFTTYLDNTVELNDFVSVESRDYSRLFKGSIPTVTLQGRIKSITHNLDNTDDGDWNTYIECYIPSTIKPVKKVTPKNVRGLKYTGYSSVDTPLPESGNLIDTSIFE